MPRLDKERQSKLEPKRIETAISEIEKLDINIYYKDDTCIKFWFNGETVIYYAYSGWHTGKSIKDGRGLKNLIKQLIKKPKQ